MSTPNFVDYKQELSKDEHTNLVPDSIQSNEVVKNVGQKIDSVPQCLPVYTYPLIVTRACFEPGCSAIADYSYSRIYTWTKGFPSDMDRYRTDEEIMRIHRSFWDFYVCRQCGMESGHGPNDIKQVSERAKAARTWKEESIEPF